MLRVVELFAGIGAQAEALRELGMEFESTVCEIDEHAYRTYCAIHGDAPNLGDITKVKHLPDCDLVTWSFPCQSLSIAGSQSGMVEGSGTTSSLGWEVIRLLADAKDRDTLPECLVMENVPALLNKRNIAEFTRLRSALEDLGYTNSYAVLNAKDYGVPQNRKRCFMVSSLRGREFIFPEPCPDGRILKDVLEANVPEAYFLSDERIEKYEEHRKRHQKQGHGLGWKPSDLSSETAPTVLTNPQKGDTMSIVIAGDLHIEGRHESANRVYDTDGLAPTIPTGAGGGHMPKIEQTIAYPAGTKQGYMVARDGDGLVMTRPTLARGTVQPQRVPTLTTGNGCGTGVVVKEDESIPDIEKMVKLRIRYLTPRECWRLMGFPDSAFDDAEEVNSKTQLYKQAGNSIAVPCLKAIFDGMYRSNTWKSPQKKLDRWCE